MAEVLACGELCQKQGLFMSEVQQMLDIVYEKASVEEWMEVVPHSIPIFVDAKECQRASNQPSKKTIATLCTGIARDQLVYLASERIVKLRWLLSRLNGSDCGTKNHDNIDVLRKLNSIFLDVDKVDYENFEQSSQITEAIAAMWERIDDMPFQDTRGDIDDHLKVAWETQEWYI
jgi:hypothetical protein